LQGCRQIIRRHGETHARIGAGVIVYLDENHTARGAGGWWLVLVLVLDTDPFREVGGNGDEGGHAEGHVSNFHRFRLLSMTMRSRLVGC
jgi:hypothetical protein